MEQIHQPPTIDIGGTDFFVDLGNMEFRQVDNPFNTIAFSKLLAVPGGLELLYDPKTLNVFSGLKFDLEQRKDVTRITLPSRQQMDPVGYALLFPLDRPLKAGRR
jgi:hypothetical protein